MPEASGREDVFAGGEDDVAAGTDDTIGDGGTDASVEPAASAHGAHPETVDRHFDWRGWTLVGVTFVAFLVVPAIIYLYPHVGPMFGLSFWDTYLALPMVPALLLAILAVWATTRP